MNNYLLPSHKLIKQLINNNILVDQLSALNTGLLSLLDIGDGAITEV